MSDTSLCCLCPTARSMWNGRTLRLAGENSWVDIDVTLLDSLEISHIAWDIYIAPVHVSMYQNLSAIVVTSIGFQNLPWHREVVTLPNILSLSVFDIRWDFSRPSFWWSSVTSRQGWHASLPLTLQELAQRSGTVKFRRPVLPVCPFWLHTLICLNSPELHCWLSSHPHCIKMLGFCFRVYVRRSQGAGTDPAKDSMPRACRPGQGLPSDLPKDSLCLHLVETLCST